MIKLPKSKYVTKEEKMERALEEIRIFAWNCSISLAINQRGDKRKLEILSSEMESIYDVLNFGGFFDEWKEDDE